MSWPGPRVFVLLRYGSALAWFGLAWPGWLGLARLGLAWLGRCGFGLGSAWLVSVAVALVWSQAKPLAPQFLSPLGGAWLVLVLGKMESGLAWLRFASLGLAWLGSLAVAFAQSQARSSQATPKKQKALSWLHGFFFLGAAWLGLAPDSGLAWLGLQLFFFFCAARLWCVLAWLGGFFFPSVL